jgi:hypothetical protein
LENAREEVEGHRMFEKQEIKTFCADVTKYSELSDVLSEV